jgi:uncharacterized membrane protein YdbT with pleckstrin-like domain
MGSYVNKNLIAGEEVKYETRLHWKIFVTFSGLFTLFIYPYIRLVTCEFVITNKRVIVKRGLIARTTFEMNLNKIETVNVDQSVWGRIFGFGTIIINGTGGTKEICESISRPLDFRRKFQEISS